MGTKFKDIDVKNHTYYFFDDIMNTKNLDRNKIKMDKILKQNTHTKYSYLLHWICYV